MLYVDRYVEQTGFPVKGCFFFRLLHTVVRARSTCRDAAVGTDTQRDSPPTFYVKEGKVTVAYWRTHAHTRAQTHTQKQSPVAYANFVCSDGIPQVVVRDVHDDYGLLFVPTLGVLNKARQYFKPERRLLFIRHRFDHIWSTVISGLQHPSINFYLETVSISKRFQSSVTILYPGKLARWLYGAV
ncbi:hypothetical protein EVAR_760_1 [Eumeta japonica]|uniref:Uncharacterized protein n=1 Tax=Eumeta variegata TaxID=151549 RepID=A0A4C1SC05_EUMVA|nr:hypothetical protein EVAR_760_1 [Eumeta japonica]